MRRLMQWRVVWIIGTIILGTGFTRPVRAQTPTGAIYGRVTDPDGRPIAGVTVVLHSPKTGELSTVTGEDGRYMFPGLPPGRMYRLKFVLAGFQTRVYEAIEVKAGTNTRLDVQLRLTAEETVVVRAATPQIDVKDTDISVHFEQEVLASLPVARDPWMVLALAPGVFVEVERLDGGSEVGRVSDFSARGAEWQDNQWHLDGMPITTVAELIGVAEEGTPLQAGRVRGTSPIYYDFDAFEEIEITAGANDVEAFTGGVIVNMVTRRGSNRFSLNGRFLWAGDAVQSDNTGSLPEDVVAGLEADRVQDVKDYGLHGGGAFRRDRLWWWAGYGGLDYDLRVPTVEELEAEDAEEGEEEATASLPTHGIGMPVDRVDENGTADDLVTFQRDRRHLDNVIVKSHARWGNHLSEFVFIGSRHDRKGFQAEFERPPETTYHQREWTPMFKVQDEWLVHANLFLSAKIGGYTTRHELMPMGGIDRPARLDERTEIWRDSYQWQDLRTWMWNLQVQSILFRLHALGMVHEIKLGAEWRDSTVRIREGFANGLVFAYEDILAPEEGGEVWLVRVGDTRAYLRHWSAYVQDTITWHRWAVLLGLRLDVQRNGLRASSTPPHPWRPDWLPGGSTGARSMGFVWTTLSPRVSISYDLHGDGRTVVTGTFALYPSALGVDEPLRLSPTGRRELRFEWMGDMNSNGVPDPEEIDFTTPTFWDHTPGDPNRVPYEIADDYRSPRTLEFTLGVERVFGAHWTVALTGFYRRAWDYIWTFPYDPTGRYTPADFYSCWVQVGTIPPEWGGWPFYACTLPKPPGIRWENRPAFHTVYWGVELRVRRRFADGWHVFGMLTIQDNRQYFRDRRAVLDPTNMAQFDGGPYFTVGWETDVMNHIRWMLKLGTTVRLPAGIDLSGTLIARDGLLYESVYRVERPSNGWGSRVKVWTHRLGARRMATFWLVNLRLERQFRLGSHARVALIVDVFNVFNRAIESRKFGIANAPELYGRATEIISPRIFRLGVRWMM